MTFLDKSTEPRDVTNDGSRFWVTEVEVSNTSFGVGTVGIVDENAGGVVAVVHEQNAPRLIEALRAFTGEV